MNTEYDKLFEHAYDDIQEYDNPLPGWWTWLFVLTIVFSGVYIIHYHLGRGATVEQSYELQAASHISNQLAQLGELKPDDETIVSFMDRHDWLAAIGGIFRGTCAQCHASDGGGNIGPNLTDDTYLRIGSPKDIFQIITNGSPGTSMPSFKDRFPEAQRILLAAYVASLRGSTPAQPKAAEGMAIAPWPASKKNSAQAESESR